MDINTYIKAFAEFYRDKQPDFADAVLKWLPLAEKTIFKVSQITKQSLEDITQNLLADLANTAEYHNSTLYRYKKRIWVLDAKAHRMLRLVSPKHNLEPLTPCWVPVSVPKKVKKPTANALVYRRITQSVPDAATRHFSQKNGFIKAKGFKSVVERSGRFVQTRKKEVWLPEQKYSLISLDDVRKADDSYDVISSYDFNLALSDASDLTQKIANIFLTEGVVSNTALKKRLKLSTRKIKCGRRELYRCLTDKPLKVNKKPVYFSTEHVS